MAVIQIHAWKTSDGQVFHNKQLAEDHEAVHTLADELKIMRYDLSDLDEATKLAEWIFANFTRKET